MEELQEEQVKIGCLFQEEQRLVETPAVRVLVGVLTWACMAAGLAGIYFSWDQPRPGGPPVAGMLGLYLTMVFVGFTLRWTFLKARLVTRVYTDHVYFKYWPFSGWPRWMMFGMPSGVLKLEDIAECEAIQYSAWKTGWGIHYVPFSYGWVFNTSGNRGLSIKTLAGKKMLIGSQKADEFYEAVKKAKGNS